MTEDKPPRGFTKDKKPDMRFSMNEDLLLRKDGNVNMKQLSKGLNGVFGVDNESQYNVLPSESGFAEAKAMALEWIKEMENDFEKNGADSKLMTAFHDGTGKKHLKVDFEQMKESIVNAKLKDLKEDYFGQVDTNGKIEINKKMKMTKKKLLDTLVHEALHNTITYGNNKLIAEDKEHYCMARTGEKNESERLGIYQTLEEEKIAKEQVIKAEELRKKKAKEAAVKGWETRRANWAKEEEKAAREQAEKDKQAKAAREQAERDRQFQAARKQAERDRQFQAAREQQQMQSIFGFQSHPQVQMHHPLMQMHHPLMQMHQHTGRSNISFQYGHSSPSTGRTFYKGGWFAPGGGRVPKGGGYY